MNRIVSMFFLAYLPITFACSSDKFLLVDHSRHATIVIHPDENSPIHEAIEDLFQTWKIKYERVKARYKRDFNLIE